MQDPSKIEQSQPRMSVIPQRQKVLLMSGLQDLQHVGSSQWDDRGKQ